MKKLKAVIQIVLSWKVIRVSLRKINLLTLKVGSANRVTSLAYGALFFIPFSREQHATVKGRYLYLHNQKQPLITRSQLRRNIHRIEKALIMKPRRDHFATNYIQETVDVFERSMVQYSEGTSPIDEAEMIWAHHVLEEYFTAVQTGNSKIDKARNKFTSIQRSGLAESKEKKVPYSADSRRGFNVSYEDFLNLCNHRRSVRWFKQKKVPHSKIDAALLAARQSPSACNRLPYEFRFFDDPELVKKVASLPFGASGYSHNIPTIAVVVGKLDHYASSRDRHAIYIDSALAAMPFMLALETQGISSSVINWPDFEPLEYKMQRLLGLDISERPIMLIAIGYAEASGGIPYSQKKELDTIRSYNRIT